MIFVTSVRVAATVYVSLSISGKKPLLCQESVCTALCAELEGARNVFMFSFPRFTASCTLLRGNTLSANIIRKHCKVITLVWQLRWRALPAAEYVCVIASNQWMRLEQPIYLYHSIVCFIGLRVNLGIPLVLAAELETNNTCKWRQLSYCTFKY